MSVGGAQLERSLAGSPGHRHATPGFRSSSRRDAHDLRRSPSRHESPSHYRSDRKSYRRPHEPSPSRGRKSRRDNEKSSRRSPDVKRSSGRGKSSRVESHSPGRPTARDEKDSAEALPPLPEASFAVKGKSEFTTAQSRAKEALEKLKRWERAFERDYGDLPTVEDMSSSNTFCSIKRKYKLYVAQMQQLIEEAAAADEPAGGSGGGESDAIASSSPDPAATGSADLAGAGAKAPGKRMAVSAESSTQIGADPEGADFEPAVVPKSRATAAFLNEAARKALPFSSLSEDEMQTILGAMFELKASAGQMLINEGEHGNNFYVAQSGSYSVFLEKIPGKAVKTYGPGDSFGELALLYNTPRPASIKCTKSGVLWALDRSAFRGILMSQKQSQDHAMLEFLRPVPLFASLTAEQLGRLASVANVLTFQGGEHVVRQGDHADSIYLIMEGSVVVMRRGEDVKHPLYRGDFFGESALADEVAETDHKRRADVVADGTVTVCQLMLNDFDKLLGSSLGSVARKNLNLKILAGVKFDGTALTSMLSSSDLDKLVDALQEESYEDGETVVEEGAMGDTFYIIKLGSAAVSTKQRSDVATLSKGDFFGEMALLRAEPRAASISAQGALTCLTLNRITFTRMLGPLQERLALEMDRRDLQMGTIKFTDIESIKLIGIGSFACVRLVLHRPTNTTYALKTMHRGNTIALNQVAHVLSEAQILKRCTHPFLPRLAATFKDADSLHMLMDYVPGGELFSVLRAQHRFLEPVAAFYAAIVVLVFEYLHDRRIVYRDLKPENLLFDAQGYLKLVDFGFSKEVVTKTWTLCGTPEYLAPEIILNKGHDRCSDWWALGILIYEMVVGSPPFTDDNDPMQVYQKVLKGRVPVPKGQRPLAKDSKEIILRLLARDVSERLGCQKLGCEEVKRVQFFSNLNWHRLEKKLIQPPYVPEIADPFDVSNFDADGLSTPRNDYRYQSAAHSGTEHLFEDF